MDANKFINLMKKVVREVVREEVKLALREEMVMLRESLRNTNTNQIVERAITKQPVQQAPVKKQTNPAVKKPLSKNSILNDLLNESRPFGANDYGSSAMSFNTNDVMSFGNDYNAFNPGMNESIVPLVDFNNNPVDVNSEAVQAVSAAMTRDYSSLMKAIDKKKGK
jgi:hypothetical protein